MSGPGPPRPPAGGQSFVWVIGVIGILVLAYITLNTLKTDSPGSRGVPTGRPLPPFAVPLALSNLEGDANIATRPGSGAEGKRPACQVRGPKVLNSSQLAERGPVVLAFMATRSQRCEQQVDVLERVRARFPGVEFAAVAIRGDRDGVRQVVRRHGWHLPVGYDHDGAVANLYAVAICPTITFARRGGRVAGTSFDLLGESALARRVEALGG
jgi:hypothetical protein